MAAVAEKTAKEEKVRRKAAISSPRIGQTRTPWFAAIGTGSMNSLIFTIFIFMRNG